MMLYVDILNIKDTKIYVSNFTDVDDKLINRSKELNESVPDIAIDTLKRFMKMLVH